MRRRLVEILFDVSDFDLEPVEADDQESPEASAKETKPAEQSEPRKIDKPNPEFREKYTKPKGNKSYFSL